MSATNITQYRSRATQRDILLSFAERLRGFDKLNDLNVVISDQVVPFVMPGGGFCVSVAPGAGHFDDKKYHGGGHSQVVESGSVLIGIFKQAYLDRPGRSEAALVNPSGSGDRALYQWKELILSRLLVEDPSLGVFSQSWEPSKVQRFMPNPYEHWFDWTPGNEENLVQTALCRNIPQPGNASDVFDVPNHKGWIGMQITFMIDWDWDLYGS